MIQKVDIWKIDDSLQKYQLMNKARFCDIMSDPTSVINRTPRHSQGGLASGRAGLRASGRAGSRLNRLLMLYLLNFVGASAWNLSKSSFWISSADIFFGERGGSFFTAGNGGCSSDNWSVAPVANESWSNIRTSSKVALSVFSIRSDLTSRSACSFTFSGTSQIFISSFVEPVNGQAWLVSFLDCRRASARCAPKRMLEIHSDHKNVI